MCFMTIDGSRYVEVDGYFSLDTRTKTPFAERDGYKYVVEHIVDLHRLGENESRAYYRKVSVGGTLVDAVLTSTNTVKRVKG